MRLVTQLEEMGDELRKHYLDMEISSHISDFWYMEKISELKFLREHLDQSLKRTKELRMLMDQVYRQTGAKYTQDIRWLKKHQEDKLKKSRHGMKLNE